MKICFIVENFYPHVGGVETEFYEFSTRLARKGHEVKVVTSSSGGVVGRHFVENVEVLYFPWMQLFGHAIPRLKDLLEPIKWADIVHTTTYSTAPAVSLICRWIGKKSIISIQEVLGADWFKIEPNKLKASLFWVVEQLVIRFPFSACHAISENTKKNILKAGIKPNWVEMIYLGVEEKFYNFNIANQKVQNIHSLFGIDKDSFVFLSYGRPGQSKGLLDYLHAIHHTLTNFRDMVLNSRVQFCFILSANPPGERKKMFDYVDNFKLGQFVKIIPSLSRDELTSIISQSNCVVVPSKTEGFGFSAAEACALGKNIISSNAGSLPEVVSGNVRIFESQSIHSLSEAIQAAIKNEWEFIPPKRFNWDQSVAKLEQLYNKL